MEKLNSKTSSNEVAITKYTGELIGILQWDVTIIRDKEIIIMINAWAEQWVISLKRDKIRKSINADAFSFTSGRNCAPVFYVQKRFNRSTVYKFRWQFMALLFTIKQKICLYKYVLLKTGGRGALVFICTAYLEFHVQGNCRPHYFYREIGGFEISISNAKNLVF